MVFMVFIYFNVGIILVGFELSAVLHSIKNGSVNSEELSSELKSFD